MMIIFYVFLASLGVQLFFFLFYFMRLPFFKSRGQQKNVDLPPVSIVICARNEVGNLRDLIPLLFGQTHPEIEIIVVNDRSTDESHNYLWQLAKTRKNLRVVQVDEVPEHFHPKKYGILLGVKAAKHDIILLTDADCRPASAGWAVEFARTFSQNSRTQIALGYSQYIYQKSLLNAFIRFETLYTGIQYLSMAVTRAPYMGVGRNLAYRKTFFLERKAFKGYQHIVGGDDDLFVNKNSDQNNTSIVVEQESLIYSQPKSTLSSYIKQKKRHLSVGIYYKFLGRVKLGFLALSHPLFWFSFLILAVSMQSLYWVLGGFLLREFIFYFVFIKSSRKLGDKINIWALPFLDLLYSIYYLLVGILVMFSRKIEWKN